LPRWKKIQEAKVEPLDKVKNQILTLLQDRKAKEVAYDEADQAYAAASKEKQLDHFAQEKKLKLRETGLFSSGDKIDLDLKIKDSALALSKGDISPVLRLESRLPFSRSWTNKNPGPWN